MALDGDVDSRDVMHRKLAAMKTLAELAHRMNDGQPIDPGVYAAACQDVIESVEAAKRCVVHIAEMRTVRRKARPVTSGGGGNGSAHHG